MVSGPISGNSYLPAFAIPLYLFLLWKQLKTNVFVCSRLRRSLYSVITNQDFILFQY